MGPRSRDCSPVWRLAELMAPPPSRRSLIQTRLLFVSRCSIRSQSSRVAFVGLDKFSFSFFLFCVFMVCFLQVHQKKFWCLCSRTPPHKRSLCFFSWAESLREVFSSFKNFSPCGTLERGRPSQQDILSLSTKGRSWGGEWRGMITHTHTDTLHQEWLVCRRNACDGKRIYGDADCRGRGLWGVV